MDRFSTEIHCTDFTFLTTKNEGVSGGNMPQAGQPPAQNTQNAVSEPIGGDDDDLPF